MGGSLSPTRPALELPDQYRAMFLRGMFSTDPVVQALISQVVPRPGPSVGAAITPGGGLPEMLPAEVARDVQQVRTVGADPTVQAIVQVLRAVVDAVVDGREFGSAGGGGGGTGGDGGQQGGGGGQQGGGGGQQAPLSPNFEADIDFRNNPFA